MSDTLRLIRGGIELREWNPDRRDYDVEVRNPTHAAGLLQYWHSPLDEVENGYTIGDLFVLLGHLDDDAAEARDGDE